MANPLKVEVAGGVMFARRVLPLFGLGGLCFLSHPNPTRVLAGVLVMAVFVGIPVWVHRVYLQTLDDQGCTVGFGKRFLWTDLKDVRVIAQKRGARTVNYRFELVFGSGTARFGYNQTKNGPEVVAFLEGIAKRKLLPS